MPTTIFSDADVISITEGYNVNSVVGSGVPVLTNTAFSNFHLTGNVSSALFGDPVSVQIEYAKNGTITFASIPTDALISRVVIDIIIRSTVEVSSTGGVSSTQTLSDTQPRPTGDLIYSPPPGTHVPSPTLPFLLTAVNSDVFYGSVGGSETITTIFDYSGNPIGRTNLFALFGSIVLKATVEATSVGAGSNSVVFGGNGVGLSNYSITVTYTVPGFSWFIPFETIIVNGRPFRIPVGSPVYATENPGGYYDSGDTEPTNTYWTSPDWWFFYPYTTIPPDDDSGWISSITPPECISCLTLTLGTITVLVADASGAYALQRNKTNDTMYVRTDPDAVTTEDAPIPSPVVKIGYVP